MAKQWSDTQDLKSSTVLWDLRLWDFSKKRWRFPEPRTWSFASPYRSKRARHFPSSRFPGAKPALDATASSSTAGQSEAKNCPPFAQNKIAKGRAPGGPGFYPERSVLN